MSDLGDRHARHEIADGHVQTIREHVEREQLGIARQFFSASSTDGDDSIALAMRLITV